MAKIKHTKTELKAQSDALKRFQRFLPMLQLKKQQLQTEIAGIVAHCDEVRAQEDAARAALNVWSRLFADATETQDLAVLEQVETDVGNIAGVPIPLYRGVVVNRKPLDLFETPVWFDDAQNAVEKILALRAEAAVLEDQRDRVTEELRTTSQRVNLFEKIKIPECIENIRVIRIFLGDQQTAAVTRGKIAKRRAPVSAIEPNKGEEEAA